jgi:hypothetical protein
MPFAFTMDSAARARIVELGFDPATVPYEWISCCDLCGWKVFRTISHVDRYRFAGIYQMCEGCGLIFQNPHPTAEGYTEFDAKWYRPLVSALQGRAEDQRKLQADQRSYAEKLIRFLTPHIEPDRIELAIDLGGSMGIVAKAVQDAFGGRCLVVDLSPDELAEAQAWLGL